MITLLLVIPLVTLIGLLAYSFITTVPGALGDQNTTTINNDVGAPLEGLLTQLNAEAGMTYPLGSLEAALHAAASMSPQQRQKMATMTPSELRQQQAKLKAEQQAAQQQVTAQTAQLKAQRARTDAAVAAYQAGQAKLNATGILPAQDEQMATALIARLKNLTTLRAEADSSTAAPLTVFEGYIGIVDAIFPYVGAMPNTDAPIPQFSQSMGTLFMGEALTDVSTEAILGYGALASGGVLTKPAYQLFQQTVAQQRQLDQDGATMLGKQSANGTDPNLAALGSPQFKSFAQLEDKIVADGPDTTFPATAPSWQLETGAALAPLTAAATQERESVTKNTNHHTDVTLWQLFGVSGIGLLLVLISSVLLLRFGGRLSRELRGLRAAARDLAFQRLPSVVARLGVGEDLDPAVEAPPLNLGTRTKEVTDTADAFSEVQRTAVQSAIQQAMLRKAVSNVFRRLARRNQGLLQRQLKMLDEMERGTQDPDALGQLFRLDHLTTRMRRQAEGLIILSGAAPGRTWRKPVPVVEVLRGAISEIEDYVRVDLLTDSPDYMQGAGVADVTHLLAELIENAVTYSPPATRVRVSGGRVANGYVVEIEDRGLGIQPEVMAALNQRLAEPPEFDVADSDQLGLFVVSRLADKQGIKVSVRPSTYGGTTAIVLLPSALVVTQEEAAYLAAQESIGHSHPGTGQGAGNGRGRVAAAMGAAADALSGRWRSRTESGGIPVAPSSGPMPAAPDGSGLPARGQRFSGSGPQRVQNGGQPATPGGGFGGAPAGGGFAGPGTGGFLSAPSDSLGGDSPDGADLPRRQKMASMAPQLREQRPELPKGSLPGKSPEQARALLSNIQRGLRSGRSAPVGDPDGNGTDGREMR
jgi:signal transduction histidine kinase